MIFSSRAPVIQIQSLAWLIIQRINSKQFQKIAYLALCLQPTLEGDTNIAVPEDGANTWLYPYMTKGRFQVDGGKWLENNTLGSEFYLMWEL